MMLRQVPFTEFMGRWQATIVLRENLPSKKNRLRPRLGGKGRGQVYDSETRAIMESLKTQAALQWGARRSVAHPDIEIRIFVANASKDIDGIWTTLADSLKKAGVIHDDSIRHFNGRKIFHPALIVPKKDERAEITLVFEIPKGGKPKLA